MDALPAGSLPSLHPSRSGFDSYWHDPAGSAQEQCPSQRQCRWNRPHRPDDLALRKRCGGDARGDADALAAEQDQQSPETLQQWARMSPTFCVECVGNRSRVGSEKNEFCGNQCVHMPTTDGDAKCRATPSRRQAGGKEVYRDNARTQHGYQRSKRPIRGWVSLEHSWIDHWKTKFDCSLVYQCGGH